MRYLPLLFILAAVACSPTGPTQLAEAPSQRPTTAAKIKVELCVRSWGEARYRGYGYDHIVHVANDCDETVACRVSTDVDTRPIQVTVPPEAHVEVVTRRGSAARKFKARATCQFVD
jgi:hypothetical protein